MNGSDDEVEFLEDGPLIVQGSIGEDVRFNSFENVEPLHFLIQLIYFLPLLLEFLQGQASGITGPLTVVSKAEIRESHLFRCPGHVFDGTRAVAVGRVDMEDTFNVSILDQKRELMNLCSFYFSLIFS